MYRLNAEERRIFDLALNQNVDYFTDYYIRGENTGTWWLPGTTVPRWKQGYDALLTVWKEEGKPEKFRFRGHEYRLVWDHSEKHLLDQPAFHHRHGFLFLDWQKMLHEDRHPIRTVVGGFGSGKTLSMVVTMLIFAATLPGFRAFALAPLSVQSMEVYRLAMDLLEGTLFKERFLIRHSRRPYPTLIVGHEDIGENTIECYSILNDVEKIRTLSGDMAIVDQAEKLENLDDVIRDVGTRFRGRVPSTGRERVGTLTLVANSADNQRLWDIYDMAGHDPDNYLSVSPSTYQNPFLTEKDLKRFELQVGNDAESRRVYLLGERPLGNGKEFSRDVIQRLLSHDLDRVMTDGINQGRPGYIRLDTPQTGVYEWLLPYNLERTYLVISDPGTDNPPNRNSPPIMVWDITEFPKQPALLVGFVWVFGYGDIKNWATRYAEIVRRYHAIGRNGFDATGFQAGYDTWMPIIYDLLSEKISLAGNMKPQCLNAAKMIASQALLQIPASLTHLSSQLTRYDIQEDKQSSKLRQDLVMAFIMSCWWMQRLFYADDSEFAPRPGWDPDDRVWRSYEDRYGEHPR